MNVVNKSSFKDVQLFKLGSNALGSPQMYVYSFLIDGILIDTGQPRVEKDFLQLLDKEEIEQIIVTHHHEDHSGNIEAIKNRKNVQAYGSKLCCEIMKNPKTVEFARWMTWGQMKSAEIETLDLSKPLKAANYEFQIIETPGHAIDQISLYEASQGWLFSGDLYVHDYVKVFMRDEKIEQQIESSKKKLLLDFDVLFCNHQPKLKKGKERLQAKLNFLEDFYGQVIGHYKNGKSVNAIMTAMGLKENWKLKAMSLGQLSVGNMIRSAIDGYKRS